MAPNHPASQDGNQADTQPVQLPPSLQGVIKPNKPTKSRSLEARGPTALPKNRGCGFEEYFADPPMTPAEADEEKNEIYASYLSFTERMQSCIQRYRSRRRFSSERKQFFDEYLFLGGVHYNPGAWGGLSRQELRDLTPAERREATARDIIYGSTQAGDRFYDGDPERWTVDFTGVVEGYLSTTLMHLSYGEEAGIELGIEVVQNFLKYVLHHDVCPEYEGDVRRALERCEDAKREWPMLRRLNASLPGQLTLAAGELFCPPGDVGENWSFYGFEKPKGYDAELVFYGVFAILGGPINEKLESGETPRLVREFSCTAQLVGVERPNELTTQHFNSLIIHDVVENAEFRLPHVGKAKFKQATIEDGYYSPESPWPIAEETLTLHLDDSLLKNMPIGMKVTMTICELDVGFRFIKTLENTVPSFYSFLPQELMRSFKAPQESDRPAPSIHDPDAESTQFASEAKNS